MLRTVRGFANLARSILVLFLFMTAVAIVMKLLGDLPWTTLGIWLLLDAGAFLVMTALRRLARRLASPAARPRVS